MAGVDYATRAVRLLLGASAHPGGTPLSRHLLAQADLPPASLVLDLACGTGTTLGLLRDAGHLPLGVDVESRVVARARRRAPAVVADAHRLPLPPGAVDAVVCECAVSTFAAPAAALTEVARVLRPGGAFAMTDVLLDRDRAAPGVVAAVDRVTRARPLAEYVALCERAGLAVTRTELRPQDARALLRRVRRRLTLVGARRVVAALQACDRAVDDGTLGYGLLLAHAPGQVTGRLHAAP